MRKLTISENDVKLFRENIIKEIDKQLKAKDASEISIKYKLDSIASYVVDGNARPAVVFTPLSWTKLSAMVAEHNLEFAVHGVVQRQKNNFIIKDIMCYPQVVSSATVTATDDYGPWLHALDDETFNNLRIQIHSHVNMGASPSGVDNNMYHDILQGIKDYYIFMIINKSHRVWINIYDIKADVLYENEDIDAVVYLDNNQTLTGWIKEQSKYIEQPTYTKRHNYSQAQIIDESEEYYGYYKAPGDVQSRYSRY